MNSPHDNLPWLKGGVYLLTFRRPDDDEPNTFATIQPDEREARARLEWMAETEWDTTVEIEAVERLEGDRPDQLAELLDRGNDDDFAVPETVKTEFMKFLLHMPTEARREMIQRIPDEIRSEIIDDIRDAANRRNE